MPRVRTTKSLAKRIDLQYFRRRDTFRKWRLWLCLSLPVIAVGWIVFSRAIHNQNVYTKGPLSSAHAVLASNCEVCHVRTAKFSAPVPDKACLGCHDAPLHNQRQTFTPSCGSCHVEHLGQMRLAQTADAGCAQCHGDLHTNEGSPRIDPHVSNFDRKHPQFAALRPGQPDPGTINLNHYAHLQATIRGPRGPMQMVCDDCHRPTNSQDPWPYSVSEVQPASQQPVVVGATDVQQRKRRSVAAGAGAYMTAIKYVNQCAACHVLQFDPLIPEPAPHDKPNVVDVFIRKKYTDYIALHPEALRQPVSAIEGNTVDVSESILRPTGNPAPLLASSPSDWVQRRTDAAERLLWSKNCKLCHISTEHQGSGLPESVKAIIPTRWLPRSEFDHEAHRMLACTACHTSIPDSRKTSDINIPEIALCRQCHKQGGASKLAAEGRCFECHSYHDWRKERRINGIMEMARPKASTMEKTGTPNASLQQ
jgi:hypothetical protein